MDVDTVVTDIDGVLLDTSDSYLRAIVDTVKAVYGETIEPGDIQAFKDAGGFNNDWRTTDAVALLILARNEGYDLRVGEFTESIAAAGGGISGAKAVLAEQLEPGDCTTVIERWDATELRRTFQWLYLGPDRYRTFEDEEPPRVQPKSAGYMDDEPILIHEETRTFLTQTYALGVLTGRPKQEATVALERVGIAPPPDRVVTMDDWDGGKPDPEGLVKIANACNATHVLYVGDELDDVKTAVHADSTDSTRRYTGVGVLSGGLRGESGKLAFREIGATAVLPSINALPAYLSAD